MIRIKLGFMLGILGFLLFVTHLPCEGKTYKIYSGPDAAKIDFKGYTYFEYLSFNIDGIDYPLAKKKADIFFIKPGRHIIKIKATRREGMNLIKKVFSKINFESTSNRNYSIFESICCISKMVGSRKYLDFSSRIIILKIKDLKTNKIVSELNENEFHPLITKQKKASVLHLYDGEKRDDDNIAILRLEDYPPGLKIFGISGESVDNIKVKCGYLSFYYYGYLQRFAFLPGKYDIRVYYHDPTKTGREYSYATSSQVVSFTAREGKFYTLSPGLNYEDKTWKPWIGRKVYALFVDDEPSQIKSGINILKKRGYVVESLIDGSKALEVIKAHPHKYDVIIADMKLPNMTGIELSSEVHKINSKIKIILSTDTINIVNKNSNQIKNYDAILIKPFTKTKIKNVFNSIFKKKKKIAPAGPNKKI